jgi:hypothetical protein
MSIASTAEKMHERNLRAWGRAPDGKPLYYFLPNTAIPCAWAPPRQTRQPVSHFQDLIALPATSVAVHIRADELPYEPAPGQTVQIGSSREAAQTYKITALTKAWAGSHYRIELDRTPVAPS